MSLGLKIALGVIAGVLVLIALIFWLIMTLTSDVRETGTAFVGAFSAGNAAGAHALMHPALVEEFPAERIAETVEGHAPYVEVSFTSFQSSNGSTSMQGKATTAGGCESRVSLELLSQKVTRFEIEPLCPAE